jgi:hypothetical protein
MLRLHNITWAALLSARQVLKLVLIMFIISHIDMKGAKRYTGLGVIFTRYLTAKTL